MYDDDRGPFVDAGVVLHAQCRADLDAAQDEIERLLSEIAALRIERDNRDDALRAVLKVHQRDGKASPYCKCGFLYSSCPTVRAVARGGAS